LRFGQLGFVGCFDLNATHFKLCHVGGSSALGLALRYQEIAREAVFDLDHLTQ